MAHSRQRRILVVSGDPELRAQTRKVLGDLGFCTECTSDVTHALARVRQRRPAAVIVDACQTQGRCGDLVAGCRAEATREQLPILVVAATPCAAIDAIHAGAQGCVKPPLAPATLVPMLSQISQGSLGPI